MNTTSEQPLETRELIAQLETDRAWLLEQIDRGRWPDLRLDLAALERELGQLLLRASEQLSDQKQLSPRSLLGLKGNVVGLRNKGGGIPLSR